MKRLLKDFKDMTAPQKGAVIGFIIAVMLAVFGLWKFLLIVIMTGAGYFIGKKLFADKESLREFLDKILPPGKFR